MKAANALLDGRCRDCCFFTQYHAPTDLGICRGVAAKVHSKGKPIYVTPDFRCIQYQPKEKTMPAPEENIQEPAFTSPESDLVIKKQLAEAAERFPSESDQRTDNNVVRHEYRVLNGDEKARMLLFKDIARGFIQECDEVGKSRELSIAKTKMEEACMWAVKHITA